MMKPSRIFRIPLSKTHWYGCHNTKIALSSSMKVLKVTTKPAVASVDSDILNSRLSILNSRPVNYTQLFVQSSSKLIHPSSCTGWDIHIRNYSTDKDQSNDPGSKTDKDQSKDPDSKKDEPKKTKKPREIFGWRRAISILASFGIGVIALRIVKKEQEKKNKAVTSHGKAAIGGPWQLTDMHGKSTKSTDFVGKWILIYFGFTNCPDVCPEELEKIVKYIDRVDDDPYLPSVKPLMISVDPERDTAEQLKSYLAEFSPKILGFTGTLDEVYRATRAYRVYYSPGPKDEDDDYIVDHSIISYLVNPKGEFTAYFGQNKKSHELFDETKEHIEKYNLENGITMGSPNIFDKMKTAFDDWRAVKDEGPAKQYSGKAR